MSTQQNLIYLDHHATTPTDPRVIDVVAQCMRSTCGKPSNPAHLFGREAQRTLEESRTTVARFVGAISSQEIVFTSGATESNNLALLGAFEQVETPSHLITSVIEHASVLEASEALRRRGHAVTVLPVDGQGFVDPQAVERALRPQTRLISLMLCNHEMGAVQPIAAIGAIARQHEVLFHCDAVQGVGRVPFDVEAMQVDLATLSGHKIYGPKGVGALYVRRGSASVALQAQSYGGGQERGFRSGTVNVPGIVGLAKAAEIYMAEGEAEAVRLSHLRDRLHERLVAGVRGVRLHGPRFALRHPGNLNLSFENVRAPDLMMELPELAVSAASACMGASGKASRVLQAMGVPEELARGALRFGIGRFNSEEEIDWVAERLIRAVHKLRTSLSLSQDMQQAV